MSSLPVESSDSDEVLDLLVVGLGPAGLSCALQAKRDGLNVLAVSDEPVGGLVRAARRLDNFPSEIGLSGIQLAQRLSQQLKEKKINNMRDRVASLSLVPHNTIRAGLRSGGFLLSRSVCIASGTKPRTWPLPDGRMLIHRDVRTLSSDLSANRVVIVGGGEAALDSALSASDRGAQVDLLVRSSRLHSVSALVEEALRAQIQIHYNTIIRQVEQTHAKSWVLITQDGKQLACDELLVCIGRVPCSELLKDICAAYQNSVMQPNQAGVFLAGDLIRGRDRYVATAMGDGQRAAVMAYKYLQEAT